MKFVKKKKIIYTYKLPRLRSPPCGQAEEELIGSCLLGFLATCRTRKEENSMQLETDTFTPPARNSTFPVLKFTSKEPETRLCGLH